MTGDAQDYHRITDIVKGFTEEDKLPVYEVAPTTGKYEATPTSATDGDFVPALTDVNKRLIVKAILDAASATINVDAAVQNWPSDYPDAALLAKLIAGIPVTNFPADYPDSAVATKLAGGLPAALDTGALKVKEQNWPSNYDVSDKPARQLGKIYGDQGVLTQRATSLDLYAALRYSGAEIDPRDIRDLAYATDKVDVSGSDVGVTLEAIDQDAIQHLLPASGIATLPDLTGNSAAQQLIVASTQCLGVVVRALVGNTGNVRVGDSSVSASRGAELAPGDSIPIDIDDVSKVYFYGVSPDKVSVTYVT